jgi:hypothetical protein
MQSDNIEEANKESTISKPTTPQKPSNAELTFGRSPIKTPRSILKGSTNQNFPQNKTLSRINKREERADSTKSLINPETCQNNLKKRKEAVMVKLDTNKREILPQRNLAPKLFEEELDDQNENDPESYKKKKKDWKSWSLQEKELFYEAIANGGNYSSLQKLFKNMNDVSFFKNFF